MQGRTGSEGQEAVGFVDLGSPSASLDRQIVGTFELTDRALFTLDLVRRIRLWNPTAQRLLGFTADEVLGHPAHHILQTVFPDSLAAITEALRTDGVWDGMVLQTAKDGHTLLVHSHQVLQRTPSGEPNAILEFNEVIDPVGAAYQTVPDVVRPPIALCVLRPVRDAGGVLAGVALGHALGAHGVPLAPTDLPAGEVVTDIFPEVRDSELFELVWQVLETREAADFVNLRFDPPWVGTEYLISGRVAPFGDGVAIRAEDVTQKGVAEQALQDAQSQMHALLAFGPVVVMQCDRELRITSASGSAGPASTDSLIGQPIGAAADPETAAAVRVTAEQVLADGRERQVTLRSGIDGAPPAFRSIIMPRLGLGGAIEGLTSVSVDVSDFAQARHELAQSQAARDRLEVALDQAPDPVGIKDLDGRFVYVNAAMAEALGGAPPAVLGKTTHELWPPERAWGDANDDRAVVAAGCPIALKRRVQTPDGLRRFVIRRFPIRDASGRIGSLGAIASDVTHLPVVTRRTDRRVAPYGAALGFALIQAEGLAVIDADDFFGELVGRGPDELPGLDFRSLLAPVAADAPEGATVEEIAAVLAGTGQGSFQLRRVRADGAPFWSEDVIVALDHPEHGPVWLDLLTSLAE